MWGTYEVVIANACVIRVEIISRGLDVVQCKFTADMHTIMGQSIGRS